jgi:hypothetical protein
VRTLAEKSCVLHPLRACNVQLLGLESATLDATSMQLTPLKALAQNIIARNRARNDGATETQNTMQLLPSKTPPKVALETANSSHGSHPDPDDDRRLCTACTRLDWSGRCLAARELRANRNYRPVLTRLRRCESYQPGAADPDRRPGPERWPSLVSDITAMRPAVFNRARLTRGEVNDERRNAGPGLPRGGPQRRSG